MPIVSLIIGQGGISELSFNIGHTVFSIGLFLQAVIDFILIAFVLFIFIKAMNVMSKKKEAAPAEPSSTDKLLMEIRDALKK